MDILLPMCAAMKVNITSMNREREKRKALREKNKETKIYDNRRKKHNKIK